MHRSMFYVSAARDVLDRTTIQKRGLIMSTLDDRRQAAFAGVDAAWEDGFARPRVVLQPIAALSILGLSGVPGATFVVVSNLAGWLGDTDVGADARAVRGDVRRARAVHGGNVGVPCPRRNRHAGGSEDGPVEERRTLRSH